MYYVSRDFLRSPDFLWKPLDEFRTPVIGGGENHIFPYPPLTMLSYASLIMVNLPPNLLIIFSFLVIVFFTYKLNSKAVPLLFISFLFLRCVIQGEADVFVAALALTSVYMFDKKPFLSGAFAVLTFLSKQTGALVLGWFMLSLLIFKRKEFSLDIKNKYLLSILFVLFVASIWYTRNYILNDGDIIGMIAGQKPSFFLSTEQFLRQGIQANSPETFFIDLSWFYPNPIDILLVLGVIFLIYDIYKKRKLDYINFFVLLSILTYAAFQILSFKTLMTIRYFLFTFPLFAILVANNLKGKYLKYLFILTIVIFIFYIFSLQKYAFNDIKEKVDSVCPEIKKAVDMKPVYVDFFHHIFLAYECDLNLTDLNHSELIINLTSGNIYPNNKTLEAVK
jgi:hypothetical protein